MDLSATSNNLDDLWETGATLPARSKITVKIETYRIVGESPRGKFIMKIDNNEEINMNSLKSSANTYTYETKDKEIQVDFEFKVSVFAAMPNDVYMVKIKIESVEDMQTGKKYEIK